jgi:hypothetical protein
MCVCTLREMCECGWWVGSGGVGVASIEVGSRRMAADYTFLSFLLQLPMDSHASAPAAANWFEWIFNLRGLLFYSLDVGHS